MTIFNIYTMLYAFKVLKRVYQSMLGIAYIQNVHLEMPIPM